MERRRKKLFGIEKYIKRKEAQNICIMLNVDGVGVEIAFSIMYYYNLRVGFCGWTVCG